MTEEAETNEAENNNVHIKLTESLEAENEGEDHELEGELVNGKEEEDLYIKEERDLVEDEGEGKAPSVITEEGTKQEEDSEHITMEMEKKSDGMSENWSIRAHKGKNDDVFELAPVKLANLQATQFKIQSKSAKKSQAGSVKSQVTGMLESPNIFNYAKLNKMKFDTIENEDEKREAYIAAIQSIKHAISHLHVLDSVHAKETLTVKRENECFRDELSNYDIEVKTSNKARELDSNYLLQQEEILAKMKIRAPEDPEELAKWRMNLEMVKKENAEYHDRINQIISDRLYTDIIIPNQKDQISQIKQVLEKSKSSMSSVLITQLEIYEESVDTQARKREEIKEMYKEERDLLMIELENKKRIQEELKEDRVQDQKKIFDYERQLGFMQVHYNYDKAKLLTNKKCYNPQIEDEQIHEMASDILDKMNEKIQSCEKGLKFTDVLKEKQMPVIPKHQEFLSTWKSEHITENINKKVLDILSSS